MVKCMLEAWPSSPASGWLLAVSISSLKCFIGTHAPEAWRELAAKSYASVSSWRERVESRSLGPVGGLVHRARAA
jgi:hypothetical protein